MEQRDSGIGYQDGGEILFRFERFRGCCASSSSFHPIVLTQSRIRSNEARTLPTPGFHNRGVPFSSS